MVLENSINAFGSFKYFVPAFSRFLIKISYFDLLKSFACKEILSISFCLFIKLSSAFVFPDPEPPIIKFLYGWSGIYGHFSLCSLLFSFVISSRLIILQCIKIKMKIKSHPKPAVNFKSVSERLKVIKGFTQNNIKVKTTQTINKSV